MVPLERKARQQQHRRFHQLSVRAAQQVINRVYGLACALEVCPPRFSHRVREPLPRFRAYLDEAPGP